MIALENNSQCFIVRIEVIFWKNIRLKSSETMPTIRVVVRFRPVNSREKRVAKQKGWSGTQLMPIYVDEHHLSEFEELPVKKRFGKQVRCHTTGSSRSDPKFAFDEVLIWVDQVLAFEKIGLPVVKDALQGINGTIFAYGQTGSGKTFSMFGDLPLTESNAQYLGVVPRCCARLFSELTQAPDISAFHVTLSFYEIYIHNQIFDLLNPAKKNDPPLRIRDTPKTGVFIENLKYFKVNNLEEILRLIAIANSHRTVSKTDMNEHSSRSHSVMCVSLQIHKNDGTIIQSKINFGDLAGSEKVRKTGAAGQTLKEAMAINQSLTALGNVIGTLATQNLPGQKRNVPFRDCALTHVLKDSLAGNCKTTLIVAVSPSKFNMEETVSTFRFGSRCKLVKTTVDSNVMLSKKQMQALIKKLKLQVKQLSMGGGDSGISSMSLSGIGVHISWPSDFPVWPKGSDNKSTSNKHYIVLEQQIIQQTEKLLAGIADGSVDEIPYKLKVSAPGKKRLIRITFQPSTAGDTNGSIYDRERCILLSKEMVSSINNQKSDLVSSMNSYSKCISFSEPSSAELQQKNRSLVSVNSRLKDELSVVKDELQMKESELQNYSHVTQNEMIAHMGEDSHIPSYDIPSNSPDFRLVTNITHSKLLSPKHLLQELLNTKYELLSVKRSLQLQTLRYMTQEKHLRQLRFVISRMQAQYKDQTNVVNLSQALVGNMVEKAATIAGNVTMGGGERDDLSIGGQPSLPLRRPSISSANSVASFLNDTENDFLSEALNMMIDYNEDDMNNGSMAADILKRQLSSIGNPSLSQHHKNASFASYSAFNPSNKQRQTLPSLKNSKSITKSKYTQQAEEYLRRESISSMRREMNIDDIPIDDEKKNDNVAYVEMQRRKSPSSDVVFNDENILWGEIEREWIENWSVEQVSSWLQTIYDERMMRYMKVFKAENINGEKLLKCDISDLISLTQVRIDSQMIYQFIDSIASDDESDIDFDELDALWEPIDSEYYYSEEEYAPDQYLNDYQLNKHSKEYKNSIIMMDDASFDFKGINASDARFYDDSTLRLTELLIDELSNNHLYQTKKLALFEITDGSQFVNFRRMKEFYSHSAKQVLIASLFGLLCSRNGLLNVGEWNKFLLAVRDMNSKSIIDYNDDDDNDNGGHRKHGRISSFFDDHLVIVTSFVDVYGIFGEYSDPETGELTVLGAKHFLAQLRRIQMIEAIHDIRDTEDGVTFLAGMRIDDLEQFIVRCPNNVWNLINAPSDIEYVHRALSKYVQNTCTPAQLYQILHHSLNALHLTADMIDESLVEMNITPDPSFVIDIWLRKLFIKEVGGNQEIQTCEFILNELMILNRELEMQYLNSLAPMEKDVSIGSDEMVMHAYHSSLDFELKVNDAKNYYSINSLLEDFAYFGNSLIGLQSTPASSFSASNTEIAHAPLLFSEHSYRGVGEKGAYEFLQIDLHQTVTVFAIALQGSATEDSWITDANLEYSLLSDGTVAHGWNSIVLGQNRNISCNSANGVNVFIFSRWTQARHIRMNIFEWHKNPCVRIDLLFGNVQFSHPSAAE